ncbi:MAG: 2-hydroxyacyl-CoA dehydratase [Caldanaerobacter sp.]|uniref:2-hydroxyacyl-CoA dehydratase n=1 Tax=Caldanaerobacter sp. TaxID=2930036 RepID=UPI003C77B78C
MKITYPHMGSLNMVLKTMFEGIGIEVIDPPPTSNRTLTLGVKNSHEFACLPFKINVGNYIEALEKGADTIVMLGGIGPCRFGYYGQVQREILKDLGYNFNMIILDPPHGRIKDFLRDLASNFPGVDLKSAIKSFVLAVKKMLAADKLEKNLLIYRAHEDKQGITTKIYEKYMEKLEKAKDIKEVDRVLKEGIEKLKENANVQRKIQLKVALVGEIYMLLEPFTNMDISKSLNELGVEVTKTEYLSDYLINSAFKLPQRMEFAKNARGYLERDIGGHGLNTVANTVKYAKLKYDGVIHILPFTCTPEIIAQGIINRISRDYDIPVMSLVYDENTGQAGYQTRIEAFVDLLYKRRTV